ncbi:winged helix domain-containing protein [Sinorhizobium fredii]|uniref:winged helix domain-containing protein n=1 Tax=Rhizobium fredii TaxID=380 RepID=UPI0035949566
MKSHSKHSYSLRVQILNNGEPEGLPITLPGRLAWMLQQLIDAGKAGVTTLENPAPRVGHYLYALRKKGFAISTTYETHAGVFAGAHGRFRLESEVKVIEDNTRAAA